MPNIIYYPTISIPDRAWLNRTLLYSRQIGSIVPYGSAYFRGFHSEQGIEADIEYLIDEEQFRAFDPQDFLYGAGYRTREKFERDFLEFLTSPQYSEWKQRCRQINRGGTRSSRTRLHNEKSNWLQPDKARNLIHESKFSYEVRHALESFSKISGTAKNGWHEIDEDIATVFVGLMAKYIGLEAGFIPATHSQTHERILFEAMEREHEDATPAIKFSLMNCLPVPAARVSPRDIVAFKRERKDELSSFLMDLNTVQGRLRKASDREEVNEIMFEYQERIERGCSDLKRLLGEGRIQSTLASMKSLTELRNTDGLALLASGGALAFSQASNGLKFGFIAGAGAIAIATVYTRAKIERENAIRENPFSYVYYVNNWGSTLSKRRSALDSNSGWQ